MKNADRHPSGSQAISVLSHIYGVGSETAKKLIRHRDSLLGVAELTKDELQEIEGVGPKTADRIWEFWHKERRGEFKR